LLPRKEEGKQKLEKKKINKYEKTIFIYLYFDLSIYRYSFIYPCIYLSFQLYFYLHRERNKVLARKTRVKKKVEMDTLRDNVVTLMKENEKLKWLLTSTNVSKDEQHDHENMEKIHELVNK